jgi:hypothetical protein
VQLSATLLLAMRNFSDSAIRSSFSWNALRDLWGRLSLIEGEAEGEGYFERVAF